MRAVARAIERRNILRADYRRFDGKSGPYEIEPLHLLAYHGNFRKCVAGGDNFDGAFSPGDSVWKRDQINTKGIHCAPAVRHA